MHPSQRLEPLLRRLTLPVRFGADLRGLDRETVFRQLRKPRDRMPPYPVERLSDDDAALIAAYVGSLTWPEEPEEEEEAEGSGGLTGGVD